MSKRNVRANEAQCPELEQSEQQSVELTIRLQLSIQTKYACVHTEVS